MPPKLPTTKQLLVIAAAFILIGGIIGFCVATPYAGSSADDIDLAFTTGKLVEANCILDLKEGNRDSAACKARINYKAAIEWAKETQ